MRDLFFVFLVLMTLMIPSLKLYAQEDLSGTEVPESEGFLSGDDEEDPFRKKLVISYFMEGEEEPFSIMTYRNDSGYEYNILHPVREGFRPEEERLFITVTENTELDIVYYHQTYSLVIHYRMLDGKAAAPDQRSAAAFGDEYKYIPPVVAGYTAVEKEVSGKMPGRDLERTVFYVPGIPVFVR